MYRLLIFLIFPCAAAGCAHAQENAITWPNGASVAVSLTYDDALDSQLDHAVPALETFGFKATFYVTVGSASVRDRLNEWRSLARSGHELGNHTIYHPCRASLPDRDWVEPQHDLDGQSVARIGTAP